MHPIIWLPKKYLPVITGISTNNNNNKVKVHWELSSWGDQLAVGAWGPALLSRAAPSQISCNLRVSSQPRVSVSPAWPLRAVRSGPLEPDEARSSTGLFSQVRERGQGQGFPSDSSNLNES